MALEPMSDSSEMVAEAARNPENARFQTGGATAGEWFARRIKNQRINNRKVNIKSLWLVFCIHLEEPLGSRDVDGKSGNGTYSISLLRRGSCLDIVAHGNSSNNGRGENLFPIIAFGWLCDLYTQVQSPGITIIRQLRYP